MRAGWTIERTLIAGFGFVALVVLFVGSVGYSSVNRLVDIDMKVSQTHQVRRDLSELQARLTDAETGQRGYVITGDERFLAPYITGLEQIKLLTAQLRVLMTDRPVQIQWLDRVDLHIEAKLAELKQTVEMRRRDGFDPAAKVVAAGSGKKIMDEIRVMIADLDRQEQELLNARIAEAQSTAWHTKLDILGVTGIGLFLVALVGWYVRSSIARQRLSPTLPDARTSSSELPAEADQRATVCGG